MDTQKARSERSVLSVCLLPRPPTSRARSAKARCCGLRRVGGCECPLPRMSTKQAQGAKLNCFLIRTICIGLSAYL